MLWQRLLFGALMIAMVVGVVTLDAWLSRVVVTPVDPAETFITATPRVSVGLPITLLVVTLVILGTFEMAELLRSAGHQPTAYWAAFVNALLAICPWAEMQQQLSPTPWLSGTLPVAAPLPIVLLAGGAVGACLLVLMRKTTAGAIGNMAGSLLMMVYLGLFASFLVRLRCSNPGPAGAGLVILFVLTVKSGDIGAFFTGKLLGKHKLAPWLSPGKTVEGAVGAIVLACVVATGGLWAWPTSWAGWENGPGTLLQLILFGALMAIMGHLGDLVESAFKRDAGIKDSGRVVPAFGGLLDLVDSPLFAAPVGWLLLTSGGAIG